MYKNKQKNNFAILILNLQNNQIKNNNYFKKYPDLLKYEKVHCDFLQKKQFDKKELVNLYKLVAKNPIFEFNNSFSKS